MLRQEFNAIFNLYFMRLKNEIEAYANEESIWKKPNEKSNSAGNLTLHLAGNLQHFIGSILGNTGYERNRNAEFETPYRSKQELMITIDAAAQNVEKTLSTLTLNDLDKIYPVQVLPEKVSTRQFLIYLSTHFSYHLGQISYHRKFFDDALNS